MRKSKFSEYQIVKILKSVEGGRIVVAVCRVVPLTTSGSRNTAAWRHPIFSGWKTLKARIEEWGLYSSFW